VSRIDDLIRDLCPGGVEHKLLKDLVRIKNGRDFKHLKQGDIPVYGSGGVISYVNESASEGPSVLIPRKGSLNKLYFVEGPFWTVDTIFYTEISSQLEPKYFYYYLQTLHLEKMNQAGGVPSLTQRTLNELHIPTPPILIQREIARMLDQFSQLKAELETELEAELEARRQQYSHFVNAATRSEHTIALGQVATFDYGLTAKARDTGTHRFIRITDISPSGHLLPNNAKYVDITSDSNRFIVSDRDILVARTGASYGKTLLVRSEIPMSFASYLIRINLNPLQIDPEFYWHFTHSRDYWKQATSLVSKGGQQQFNSNALKRIETPILPLAQQREIARSLNRLYSLAHNLTSDLSTEIEARRKQYEYYRDHLLTFPEKK